VPSAPTRAVQAAADTLRVYVERDRELWAGRRTANVAFRQARLMLGHVLNETRLSLTRTSFGAVLRRVGIHRSTAHHAMRLAAEFARPDGSLDLDKIADARDRNAGLLRTSIPGQRVLAAMPDQVTVGDLRELMRVKRRGAAGPANADTHGACTRHEPERMVEPVSTQKWESAAPAGREAGCTRHEPERMVEPVSTQKWESDGGDAGVRHPLGSSPVTLGEVGGVKRETLHAAASPAASPAAPQAAPTTAFRVGAQMTLPFDEAVDGLTRRLRQVVDRALLGSFRGDPRLDELRGVLGRADDIALSLLRGGAGESPAPPLGVR
jgi:hypothetical protein